jgi:hypothetical protein
MSEAALNAGRAQDAYPADSSPFAPAPERPLVQRLVPVVRNCADAGLGNQIGAERFYPTIHAAAQASTTDQTSDGNSSRT